MTIEEVITRYGIWGVIVYLFFREALPTLSNLTSKLGEMIVPAWSKSRQQLVEVQMKQEEMRSSLREREVIAMEQISKALAVIETRLQQTEQKLELITTSLVTANQALAVMLDRANRSREEANAGNK